MFPNPKHHLERIPEILEPFNGPSPKLHRHWRIPRPAVPYWATEADLQEIQRNLPDSSSSSTGNEDPMPPLYPETQISMPQLITPLPTAKEQPAEVPGSLNTPVNPVS